MTRALADSLETTLVSKSRGRLRRPAEHRDQPAARDHLGHAVFGPYTPAENQTPRQREAIALAHELADELINADAFIFAVPFYNFGVSQHFQGMGRHRAQRAALCTGWREPHWRGGPPSSSWRGAGDTDPGRRVMAGITARPGIGVSSEDIWKLDVQVIECELTLADVTPAMEGLRPQAAENLATAHSHAQDNAMQLARRLAA